MIKKIIWDILWLINSIFWIVYNTEYMAENGFDGSHIASVITFSVLSGVWLMFLLYDICDVKNH